MKGGEERMIKGHKAALVIGIYVAAMHAVWMIAVALGIGQAYLDWILPLHLVVNPFTVMSFSILNALLLVAVAFVGGYAATWLFVWLWNAIKTKK